MRAGGAPFQHIPLSPLTQASPSDSTPRLYPADAVGSWVVLDRNRRNVSPDPEWHQLTDLSPWVRPPHGRREMKPELLLRARGPTVTELSGPGPCGHGDILERRPWPLACVLWAPATGGRMLIKGSGLFLQKRGGGCVSSESALELSGFKPKHLRGPDVRPLECHQVPEEFGFGGVACARAGARKPESALGSTLGPSPAYRLPGSQGRVGPSETQARGRVPLPPLLSSCEPSAMEPCSRSKGQAGLGGLLTPEFGRMEGSWCGPAPPVPLASTTAQVPIHRAHASCQGASLADDVPTYPPSREFRAPPPSGTLSGPHGVLVAPAS